MGKLIIRAVFIYHGGSLNYWRTNRLEDLENGHYFANKVSQSQYSHILAIF